VRFVPLRRALIETAREMNACGLNQGTSGNVSVRTEDGFLITPTGMLYETLKLEDLVEVRNDGRVDAWQRLPSSEWRMHRDVYRVRPEAGAVFHCHPMFATTLSILRREIPAVHYMIAVTGAARVRCGGYATFGSEELSAYTLEALEGCNAALMANHGLITLGPDLGGALRIAREVENLAAQYWRALQVGIPFVLDDDEMTRVLAKFRTYGQQSRDRRD